jgi:hypothetical protein
MPFDTSFRLEKLAGSVPQHRHRRDFTCAVEKLWKSSVSIGVFNGSLRARGNTFFGSLRAERRGFACAILFLYLQ